jgi:hypothetical protein
MEGRRVIHEAHRHKRQRQGVRKVRASPRISDRFRPDAVIDMDELDLGWNCLLEPGEQDGESE